MNHQIDYVCKIHRQWRLLDRISQEQAEGIYYAFKNGLKELLDYYSQKFGLKYFSMDLKVRGRRIHGQCDRAHHIGFNLAIIDYSPEYIRYVVIHELCHTKHPSHRYCFWKLVESCLISEGLIPPGDYVKREQFAKKADNEGISFPIPSDGKQVPYFTKKTAEIFKKVRSQDKTVLFYELNDNTERDGQSGTSQADGDSQC